MKQIVIEDGDYVLTLKEDELLISEFSMCIGITLTNETRLELIQGLIEGFTLSEEE